MQNYIALQDTYDTDNEPFSWFRYKTRKQASQLSAFKSTSLQDWTWWLLCTTLSLTELEDVSVLQNWKMYRLMKLGVLLSLLREIRYWTSNIVQRYIKNWISFSQIWLSFRQKSRDMKRFVSLETTLCVNCINNTFKITIYESEDHRNYIRLHNEKTDFCNGRLSKSLKIGTPLEESAKFYIEHDM